MLSLYFPHRRDRYRKFYDVPKRIKEKNNRSKVLINLTDTNPGMNDSKGDGIKEEIVKKPIMSGGKGYDEMRILWGRH